MGQIHATTSRRRLVIAGTAGNIMEWYDFAVYGYFALVIGKHFFPSDNPATSLIASFGAFAAGFLMRPLGGMLFGHIGDKTGRKSALTLSVLAMAIPTFLIGVLPDHSQIGATAAVLLVLLRMIQGLSVGGECTTSVVFLVEGAASERRGFAGSWSTFGAVAGILLGSAVGAVTTNTLTPEALHSWGWRLPFYFGLLVGLAGLYIRRQIPESIKVVDEANRSNSPVLDAFRYEWRSILRMAGLNVLNAVGFYMIFVYVVTYEKVVVHLEAAEALDINTVNMGILLLIVPAAGALSDRLGRKPVLLAATMGVLVFAWPLFWLMHHPIFAMVFLGQMGFSLFIGLFLGVVPVAMVENFPGRVRCSGLSIGYNLCLGLIGGTTPIVTTYLIERSHYDLSPAYYMMLAAAISTGVVLSLPETFKRALG
jgi:MFS transporter, MHS family, proline/betaine transporter